MNNVWKNIIIIMALMLTIAIPTQAASIESQTTTQVVATLSEGEIATYTINGLDYETALVFISDPTVGGRLEAKFSVNGQLTDSLASGDSRRVGEVASLTIRDIQATSRAGSVTFILTYAGPIGAQTCQDTDNGINYNIRGHIIAPGMDPALATDFCDTSFQNSNLREYYCDANGNAQSQQYNCPNGCSNGVCNNPTPTQGTCTDTDYGNNANLKGTLTFNNVVIGDDFCNAQGKLNELYCVNSNTGYTSALITCPYGCASGVCKPAPTGQTVTVIITPNSNGYIGTLIYGGQSYGLTVMQDTVYLQIGSMTVGAITTQDTDNVFRGNINLGGKTVPVSIDYSTSAVTFIFPNGFAMPGSTTYCDENGVRYTAGDSFARDCNTCSCTDSGRIVCTMRACPPPTDDAKAFIFIVGETAPASDLTTAIDTATMLQKKYGIEWFNANVQTMLDTDAYDQFTYDEMFTHTFVVFNGKSARLIVGQKSPTDQVLKSIDIQKHLTSKGISVKTVTTEQVSKSDLLVGAGTVYCDVDGAKYTLGETFKQECNTCTCTEKGIVACTKMKCQPTQYTLSEGESKTYTVNGNDHEVTLVFVSDNTPQTGTAAQPDVAQNDPATAARAIQNANVKFSIDGELSMALAPGQSFTSSNGVKLTVLFIAPSAREGKATFTLETVPTTSDQYTLREGETKYYYVDSAKREVTLVFVSDPNGDVKNSVKFSVDKELSESISVGGSDTLSNGITIYVTSISASGREGSATFRLIGKQDDEICTYNGHRYAVGQTFKNDCNTCTCNPGGQAVCTKIACHPVECDSNADCSSNQYCKSGFCSDIGDVKECTADAKICPDGTTVGRTGPNCEFAPCGGSDPAGSCSAGCSVDNRCLPYGTRIANGDAKFCDISGSMSIQKTDGADCQNSYECLSNQCLNAKCQSLDKQLQETQGTLERVVAWLRSVFGFGK